MKKKIILDPDGIKIEIDLKIRISEACDYLESIYANDFYPSITIKRHWSEHNPIITGEFARPADYRWYLTRELKRLISMGATIEISASRQISENSDKNILYNIDEDRWDFRKKKLFLFMPERIETSIDRLTHYTGSKPSDFQRNILLTNYDNYIENFKKKFPDYTAPGKSNVQMPAYHYKLKNNAGITIINIGVGPSNAKTITDHLAVLRPDAIIMIGHCGGLRNHQDIGDFVLASGYMRDDKILDDILPLNIPLIPNYFLNSCLQDELKRYNQQFRIGTVFTTANRNWEFLEERYIKQFSLSRSIAIDMESATIAANGFRYRIPHAALLVVSDKPFHGKPKNSIEAKKFYDESKDNHLEIAINVLTKCRNNFPGGFPNYQIRGFDEPLLGGV